MRSVIGGFTNDYQLRQVGPVIGGFICVCEVGTVGEISDYQPEGPAFKPRPGRGLNFG